MQYFFAFLFGLVCGSFVNVLVTRRGTRLGIGGRSHCTSCGTQLKFWELVPVISYVCQAGKCTTCKSHISPLYVVGELLTAFYFVWALWVNPITGLLSGIALAVLLLAGMFLVAIGLYDIRHTIIPDEWAFIAGILLFVYGMMGVTDPGFTQISLRFFSAVMLALPFFLLWWLSQGKWMGLGDAKLAFGLGLLLTPPMIFPSLAYSFWIGAGVSLILMVVSKLVSKRKKITLKSEVPFAPFLIVGVLLAYTLHVV